MARSPARPYAALTALALGLVLVVLVVSAAIRLGMEGLPVLRGIHRTAASLEVLAVLALLWFAWRRTLLAAGLTVFLSVLGIAAGQDPPPSAALGNLLGGLALTASFAWMLGRLDAPGRARWQVHAAAALLAVQCALGAWLALFAEELWSVPLLLHAMLGCALAAALAWLALRLRATGTRLALLGVALAAPAAGFASALFGQPLAASLAHAAAAALLVGAAAYAYGRLA